MPKKKEVKEAKEVKWEPKPVMNDALKQPTPDCKCGHTDVIHYGSELRWCNKCVCQGYEANK